MFTLSLLAIALQTEPLIRIAPAPDVRIDGQITAWEEAPLILLKPGTQTDGLSIHGQFGNEDLSLAARAGWSDAGLFFAFEWVDDRWDVPVRSREQGIWVGPDGSRRDAMYLSDNLKVQIWTGRRNYTSWLSPHLEAASPYQWHSLRIGDPLRELHAAQPLTAVAEGEDSSVTVELMIPWDVLGVDDPQGQLLELMFVVADSDDPLARESDDPFASMRYMAWMGQVEISSPLRP